MIIVDYMKKRSRYQEAVTIYNDLIQRVRQQGDTLGEMMNTAKWDLAEVYRRMGRGEQAANLYEQVLEIQDTLKTRKAKNTAQELAAVYHEKEQEQTIMQQQAKASRANLIALGIGILTLVFLAFAVILFFKNRFISHKNHILVQQITDALKFKDLYLKEKRTQEPKLVATEPDSLTDEQLFKYINKVIVQEKLFLDPNFERQTIIDRFQLSKERVGAVFSKGSDHSKMSNYIQQLRLEYAAKLLIEQPDKSIVQIASDCGFSSNTYFSDRFRKCFGMSPTDFRKVTLHSSYE